MSESIQKQFTLDDVSQVAEEFLHHHQPGQIYSLEGDLGSGKTTFSFHVLQALGVKDLSVFSSPTFSLHNIYETEKGEMHHLDLYRLSSYDEWQSLDLEESLKSEAFITFIEWGNRFPEMSSLYDGIICFEHDAHDDEKRTITLKSLK
jgi:tRNA threonylcarbamoyl adenosine modification protein YjeE